eukprot:TRINITY_DN37301_c0_g1_i2.p1 TRINITY_DN37301_c0_g1~~TRINITY_DN37301_c0_g1_i2.p1  ORF type:complete len:226 (+),score=32.90 TRINITY_DN37301_c0_g1_i2:47-724(+)
MALRCSPRAWAAARPRWFAAQKRWQGKLLAAPPRALPSALAAPGVWSSPPQCRRFATPLVITECGNCTGLADDGTMCSHQPLCRTCRRMMPRLCQDANLYGLLGLEPAFDVGRAIIDEAYKRLQKELHPDKHAQGGAEEISIAESHASRLNHAANVLRSPLRRAQYWMELHGRTVLSEDQRVEDMALLMEVMEMSEELEDAKSKEEVEQMEVAVCPNVLVVADIR